MIDTAMAQTARETLASDFPVFDADGHVNDPPEIWSRYVAAEERELVRQSYWKDERGAILNGRQQVTGGARRDFDGINPVTIGGPGMDRKLIRRLRQMRLSDAQCSHLDHAGAVDARARAADMDLMGIDQALILPTMLHAHLPFVADARGAAALCRAYNNWAHDWCGAVPGRLFPAGLLPLQSPAEAVRELDRIAALGFRVALLRPIDAGGLRSNVDGTSGGRRNPLDALYHRLEETGIVLAVHPLPIDSPGGSGMARVAADLFAQATADRYLNRAALSYMMDGMAWLVPILMAGVLDRHPGLRVAILASNASWLAPLLDHLDRLFTLYRSERRSGSTRHPSEAFRQQCVISFKSGEGSVVGLEEDYRDVAIWGSDGYHIDGSDAWRALGALRDAGVDDAVAAALMGGNARRAYRIEARKFVRASRPPIPRPDWFPSPEEIDAWWARETDPARPGGASRSRLWSRLAASRVGSSLIARLRARR